MPIKGLTQSTDSLNLIENNRNLRKGLECFEQMKQKKQQVDDLKQVIDSLHADAFNRDTLETLLYEIICTQNKEMDQKINELCEMENQLNISRSQFEDIKKRKRISEIILGTLTILIAVL